MPNDSSEKQMEENLENNTFVYNTMSFVFTRRSNNVIEIFDVYRIIPTSTILFKRFGSWNQNNGWK